MDKQDKTPHINLDYFEDLTGNIKDGEKRNHVMTNDVISGTNNLRVWQLSRE